MVSKQCAKFQSNKLTEFEPSMGFNANNIRVKKIIDPSSFILWQTSQKVIFW